MKIEITNETMFSFEGPNLCFLGSENDFKRMAQAILELTVPDVANAFTVASLDFTHQIVDSVDVVFSSKKGGEKLGVFSDDKTLLFELDDRYWERIFKYFVLLSWKKTTYYLNSFEDCLRDLPLEQDCHFICSSEW